MDVVVYALLKKQLEGKANLVDGKIPADELPSYVDDVVEYPSKSQFPSSGESGKIYVALDTGYTYRWSGSTYVQIGGGSTYQVFGNWPTSSTTKAFCDAINNDSSATIGMAYLGSTSFSDGPFVGNGDTVVEILPGPNNSKAIHLIITSGNIAPYRWEYTYWNNGSNVSGWIAFQQELVSGTNIRTVNNTSLLGSGDVTISGTTFIVTDVVINEN